MTLTDKLRLPLIETNQLLKHVTHNEAMVALEALTQIRLEAVEQNSPPVSPSAGNTWGVGEAPTDDWANNAGEIAYFDQMGWHYFSPVEGMLAWHVPDNKVLVYNSGAWQVLDQQPSELQNASFVGVATTADAANRFALKPKVLCSRTRTPVPIFG